MRRPIVAMLALVGLLCTAILGFAPVTRAGVQCPTAPVQSVVVRDCCHRVVTRAPRPGDRAFLQCRCAEKKAASTQAIVGQKVDLFFARSATMEIDFAFSQPWTVHPYSSREATWSSPPALRPPTLS